MKVIAWPRIILERCAFVHDAPVAGHWSNKWGTRIMGASMKLPKGASRNLRNLILSMRSFLARSHFFHTTLTTAATRHGTIRAEVPRCRGSLTLTFAGWLAC